MTDAELLTAIGAAGAPAATRGTLLDGAQPPLIAAAKLLYEKSAARGIRWRVADFGGLRTEADTARILQYRVDDWAVAIRRDPKLPQRTTIEKWRRIAPWGNSMHNYGAAFDVLITSTPAGMTKAAALLVVRSLAGSCGLALISDDPPHFELPGGLARQRLRYFAQTGQKYFAGLSTVGTLAWLAIAGLLIALLITRRS